MAINYTTDLEANVSSTINTNAIAVAKVKTISEYRETAVQIFLPNL